MIYNRIRELREDNNLNQSQLADFLHVKQTTYSKYELGKINISTETFMQIAKFYNVSVDYLLGLTDIKEPPTKSTRPKI